MANNIYYDSNEISGIVSKVGSYVDLIQSDVELSLNRDFQLLKELDFFSEGLDLLLSKSDNLIYLNNKMVNSLNTHDSDFNELENGYVSLFNQEEVEVLNEDSYGGTIVTIDEIVLNKVSDGKVILTEYVNEVIPSFSYEKKIEVLKSILNEGSLNMLTDPDESDLLIYQLKDLLNESYSIEVDKLSTEEEKELQKSFFEIISDNDTNIFDEFESNSFLHGLAYYKQVAQKNGINSTDLLFNKENNELFMNTLNEIYNNGDQIDVLTENQVNSVKGYIDDLATTNNISVNELLTNSRYSSVLKGGINNEG